MLDGAEKLTLQLELAAQDTLPWVIVLEQCVVEELGSTWKLPIQSFADFPIGTNTQGLFRIQDELLLLLLLFRKISHRIFQVQKVGVPDMGRNLHRNSLSKVGGVTSRVNFEPGVL